MSLVRFVPRAEEPDGYLEGAPLCRVCKCLRDSDWVSADYRVVNRHDSVYADGAALLVSDRFVKAVGSQAECRFVPLPGDGDVRLHNDLNEFLDPLGMRPSCVNSGEQIRRDFPKEQRIKALEDFYRSSHGSQYTEVAKHFFNNMSNPSFVAAVG